MQQAVDIASGLATLCCRGWCGVAFLLLPMTCLAQDPEGLELFERRIRPVLVEHCYECHSGRARKAEGGLRLDSRESSRRGGESGPAVVPGKPAESLILDALRHETREMPPGRRLPAHVAADFERWIRSGAADPREPADALSTLDLAAARRHWAFQPLRRPAIPGVRPAAGDLTPVDRFVRTRLESLGLSPAPAADRATLARRAYLDLLGVPPTPEQLDAFLADNSADAFGRLVDRLLASPHYGERWGRHWLDVARYADNKGYVFFEEKRYPWAWTYRDYVIDALNRDLPFDRFVLEQLAADQLDLGADQRPLAAMGFLTLGARFMNNTHDVLDDRIDVVTRGLMGLTVSCARCHDHKYDPITQEDYYALYGVFRSSPEPLLPPEFLPPDRSPEYQRFADGMRERLDKLDQFVADQRQQIIAGARRRVAEYLLAVHQKRDHPETEDFMLLTDKGALNPAMIHRWELYLKRARQRRDPVWTAWFAYADLPTEGFAERAAAVHPRLADQPINPWVRELFAECPPESMADVARRYGEVFLRVERQYRATQASGDGHAPLRDPAAEPLWQVLYAADSPAMIPRELSWGFLDLLPDRPTQEEFKKLLKELESWSMNQPAAPPRAMVLRDAETPYEPVVFLRGNPHRRGRPVPRRFPTFLSPDGRAEFSRGSGRLELAQRIVDRNNPLTARVLVNRVWLHHFGRGLVDTPSDFGLRSRPPSHPELLDWLAVELLESGWSLKALHRTIMNSAVYRQASSTNSSVLQKDPDNRWLSRFPRRRLDYEAMRDSLLAVAGAWDNRVGGPAVDQVDHFSPRRSVYGFIDRMDLPGQLRTFDFPEPAATSPGREQTIVAPQALFFMNHEAVVECARRLVGRREVASQEQEAERVEVIYRLVFGRLPDATERKLAREYLSGRTESQRATAWSYGFGQVDETTGRVGQFTPLRHWTGSRWQAGPKLPDPQLGWVFLDRLGGHPAATLRRCAIRRWTAPRDGTIEIQGVLRHHPEPGNGVRGRLISSRFGELGQWRAHHSQIETAVPSTAVEAGDTIDLVVDFQGEILHDEHEWPVTIQLTSPTTSDDPEVWDSQRDFRGAASDRWVDFVHALLMTNEFVFVD